MIDLERRVRQRHGLRRVLVGKRLRGADERRRPARVGLEHRLERFQRFAVLLRLKEELAPAGVDRRISGRPVHRELVRGVGIFQPAESTLGARPARDFGRIGLRSASSATLSSTIVASARPSICRSRPN